VLSFPGLKAGVSRTNLMRKWIQKFVKEESSSDMIEQFVVFSLLMIALICGAAKFSGAVISSFKAATATVSEAL
jgi:Flp pilus assembly pilin Flp